MNPPTTFPAPLAPVITRSLALKMALGRRYATERQLLRGLDTLLGAEPAAALTLEVFERWCQSQAHRTSGIQRTQMRMVRHLCLYRRRTEPACVVPDIAFFPPCHQSAPPSLLTEDERARLLATPRRLSTPSADPLRAPAMRGGVVLLYPAGLRRGELRRLTRRAYAPQAYTLLLRAAQFHTARRLPLSADAGAELTTDLAGRRGARPDTLTAEAPLIWQGGTALHGYSGSGCGRVCRTLARQAGVLKANGQPPRVPAGRHRFAVGALLRWDRAGLNVHAKVPLLSTSMGHVSIASPQSSLPFVEPVARAASARCAQPSGPLLTPHAQEETP